jgi:archaellum biogenesis ATPase FlaH
MTKMITNKENENLESALEYASNGMPVFPVHTPTIDGGCSCNKPDCRSIGKHPRTVNGLKDASTDEEQIKKWWKKHPDANIGLVTGSVSGLIVLDIDDGGEEELSKHPSLPDTVESVTGSGGRHIFFANPEYKIIKNKVKFCVGLDIRAEGGYVVVPPSLHASGKRYERTNGVIPTRDNLAECPEWLIEATDSKKRKELITSTDNGDKIPEGARNDTLFKYASRLRNNGLLKEEIITLVTSRNKDKCETPLDEREIMRLIESALSYPADNDVFTVQTKTSLADVRKGWLEVSDNNEYVKTPFNAVNLKLGGLKGLVCLQAIPKVGKSTWAMQVGIGAAQQGIRVNYLDYENGKAEIMKRVYQQVVECETHELKEKIATTTLDKWAEDNFLIYGSSDIRRPEQLELITGDQKSLIIVDSIQRLPSLQESTRASINQWLEAINKISRDGRRTVLAISELNRSAYDNKKTISGGKESGEIEYIADTTLRLDTTKESGICSLNILLSRNSGTGCIGRFGLTKYRKFVENPDPESFKEIRFDNNSFDMSAIQDAINMFERDDDSGRVYVDDLANVLDTNTTALGRTLKNEYLTEIGFSRDKERRVNHEKCGKTYIKRS